jgi:erythromycin esterase-like protein
VGWFLWEWYGEHYYRIALDAYGGTFTAIPFAKTHQIPLPPGDSVERFFHQAGDAGLFLDLRGLDPTSAVGSWLGGQHCLLSIGATYDETRPELSWSVDGLPQEYDAIIYIEQTTASHILPPQ